MSGLNFLLLGFLLALLIFGFNTPLLPEFQITYGIPSSWPEWLTALGTIGTALVAVIIAIWRDDLEKLLHRPKMIIHTNSLENIQNHQGQTRLIFENKGKATARDVEVYINKIFDNNTDARENFIAVPLSWTHDGRPKRDFHPNQFGYLDLCRINNVGAPSKDPVFVLSAGAGVPTYQEIKSGKTKIELIIFQASGQKNIYEVHLSWKEPQQNVNVASIKKIS